MPAQPLLPGPPVLAMSRETQRSGKGEVELTLPGQVCLFDLLTLSQVGAAPHAFRVRRQIERADVLSRGIESNSECLCALLRPVKRGFSLTRIQQACTVSATPETFDSVRLRDATRARGDAEMRPSASKPTGIPRDVSWLLIRLVDRSGVLVRDPEAVMIRAEADQADLTPSGVRKLQLIQKASRWTKLEESPSFTLLKWGRFSDRFIMQFLK
jgi:hypothetical protein